MKKVSYLLFFLAALAACRQDRKEVREKDQEIPEVRTPEVTAEDPKAGKLPYESVVDANTGQIKLVHTDSVSRMTAHQIVEAANIKYPEIRLELRKVARDTAFVKINDATYLTQEMGSAGAECYLSEVTFSLTSIRGVKAVRFDFPEGDHASPGTYTRQNFEDLQQTNQ